MNALEVIALLEAAMNLAASAQINLAKLQAMREANGGAPLTDEQRQELAADAQEAIDRL